jgi:hypothetical protein
MDSNSLQEDPNKPEKYKAVRVWLADGTRTLGMWTGERWWSTKGEITPARWDLEERKKKKTKKLRKALRKSEEG